MSEAITYPETAVAAVRYSEMEHTLSLFRNTAAQRSITTFRNSSHTSQGGRFGRSEAGQFFNGKVAALVFYDVSMPNAEISAIGAEIATRIGTVWSL